MNFLQEHLLLNQIIDIFNIIIVNFQMFMEGMVDFALKNLIS